MNHEELTRALETVHHELSESEDLDQQEVERLRQTMLEIQSVLDQREQESATLSERVSTSARRFEESHPTLTQSLGRIADMLQQMGI